MDKIINFESTYFINNNNFIKRCFYYCSSQISKINLSILSLIIFSVLCSIFLYFHCEKVAIALIPPIGLSLNLFFTSQKQKLDEANYQTSLFPERFEIFSEIARTLWEYNHPDENKNFNLIQLRNELDKIHWKSLFLFNDETVNFIDKIKKSISDIAYCNDSNKSNLDKKVKAQEFLRDLLDERLLVKQFPQLKLKF